MEGSPCRKFSFSRGKGVVLGTGPRVLRNGEPGFLLAGILRTGVPSSGDPEAAVLPGVPAPRFRIPTPGFLPPGMGPYILVWVLLPAYRPSDLSCLRINENLPLISTSTTLLTGSGHDLQPISKVPPCSLKHLDTSCSLQHIDKSTICSGHVPPRTDDSYQLQSYVLPRLCVH
ncbi:hypothetical protein DY000_02014400 [Brassica cretica]|uniref:Uncharacterized protein n=1 Tax=Brassica cretica TaxID=69181 RepID=A0ABQ7DAB3_BRACR|nr:hypothetical protein DY000_02014400 [Brassica cretica]